jgi:signal transduction histidine kinase
MSTYHHAVNEKGEFLFGNFPSEAIILISNNQNTFGTFDFIIGDIKQKVRFGFKSNHKGIMYTLSSESKYVKSNKLFKELVSMSIVSLESLSNFKNEIIKNQNTQTQELVHNLTSLNTYNIQDLYALIPQESLTKNINVQSKIVKDIIQEKPNVTVSTLLQLIKYNLAMKVEFSVFDKILKQNPSVQKMEDSIRNIILSILQIFIADFDEKKIEVSLSASEKRFYIDYDSFTVSLFYILDNAIKYCCRNTHFKIILKEEKECFSILFDMVSIKIEDEEVSRLCEKNYRSKLALKLNEKGSGIGMYRILKTLKLNDAELEILPRVSDYTKKTKDGLFEHNQFKIKFKGKQDWFKANLA